MPFRRLVAGKGDKPDLRERAHEMLEIGLAGNLQEFTVDPNVLKPAALFVAGVIRKNYPDLKVTLHARWRHFTGP